MTSNETVLVDSSVWIHFLRGSGVQYQERLVPLIMADRLATLPVIIMELLRGATAQKQYDKLHNDLKALLCFELTDKIWQRAYKLGFTLRQKGLNIPLTDSVIAAVALEHDLLLLHDDKHYEMIASATSLKHEWLR